MEFYHEILYKLLRESPIALQETSLAELFESRCYQALAEIKAVLEDDTLDDPECFERIEKIVCIFEKLGNGVEYRHDFG